MGYKRKKDYSKFWGYFYVIVFLLIYLGPMIYGFIDDSIQRDYRMYNATVGEASIAEKNSSGSKYYVRVSNVTNMLAVENSDDMWIEVVPDFYNRSFIGSRVGVLMGNFEIYKPRFFGLFGKKGSKIERTATQVVEIYDSYLLAQQANPYMQISKEMTLKKKVTDKDGKTFFVMDVEGQSLRELVRLEQYNKYNPGDKLFGLFESVGSFKRFIGFTGHGPNADMNTRTF